MEFQLISSLNSSGHRASADTHDGKNSIAQFPAAIQMALDVKILSGQSKRTDMIGEIARSVIAYNTGIRSKTNTEKINELHTLEHLTYRWFDENKMPDLNEARSGPALKKLLNNIQSEHQLLVENSLNDTNADPPVANFDSLDTNVQQKVRQIWNDLVNGTGNILIEETQTYTSKDDQTQKTKRHKGFNVQILSAFARLLSTNFGRQLVGQVNRNTNGVNVVTIKPGFSAVKEDIPPVEFAASANNMDSSQLQELDLKKWFGGSKKGSKQYNKKQKRLNKLYPEQPNISNDVDEKTKLHYTHNLTKKSGTEGFRVHVDSTWHYYTFGSGTGSSIYVPSDVKDGSDGPMSRFVDEEGNEIIVPVFITLGHELGHALHSLRGAQTGHDTAYSLRPVLGEGINVSEYSSSLEEVVTIRGVENKLREEHGLSERHSHHNVISWKCKEIMEGPVSVAYSEANKLPNPFRGYISNMLKQIDSLLGDRQLKQAKKKLVIAQQEILKVQQKVQELQQQKELDDSKFLPRVQKLFEIIRTGESSN